MADCHDERCETVVTNQNTRVLVEFEFFERSRSAVQGDRGELDRLRFWRRLESYLAHGIVWFGSAHRVRYCSRFHDEVTPFNVRDRLPIPKCKVRNAWTPRPETN